MISKINWSGMPKIPPHEHEHRPTRLEFGLAIVIAILLTASLLSEQFVHVPSWITPILILVFVGIKIWHIVRKGGTLLEDYAAIAVIGLFLVLYMILKAKVEVILVTSFIFILFYSAGLTLWVRSTFGSKKIAHFIVSYIATVIMIIFLFAGAYHSRSSDFVNVGIGKDLSFEESLYFSTITFTTVGYGDILPLGINRLFAALEALIGMVLNIALIGYVLSSGRIGNNHG